MPARRSSRARRKVTRLQDPRAIRALAHPARMAIIDALGSGEELTATECAAVTGLSPSATAYHLTMLERYGFAERAPGRADGRERPWRATDRRTTFDLDPTTPAGSAATAAVALAHFDSTRALGQDFIATEHEEPAEWRDAAAIANSDVWLTADETRELVAALMSVVEPYRERSKADRPDGTRRVRVMNVVAPHRSA